MSNERPSASALLNDLLNKMDAAGFTQAERNNERVRNAVRTLLALPAPVSEPTDAQLCELAEDHGMDSEAAMEFYHDARATAPEHLLTPPQAVVAQPVDAKFLKTLIVQYGAAKMNLGYYGEDNEKGQSADEEACRVGQQIADLLAAQSPQAKAGDKS